MQRCMLLGIGVKAAGIADHNGAQVAVGVTFAMALLLHEAVRERTAVA